MIFTQLNPGSCRTYLIADEKSKEAVLVNPVLEHVPDYLKTIEQQNLTLTHRRLAVGDSAPGLRSETQPA